MGLDDPVVHPLALAPGIHNAGFAQISQMTRNLGLWALENFHEIANANFIIAHEIQQSKSRLVGQ